MKHRLYLHSIGPDDDWRDDDSYEPHPLDPDKVK